MRRPPERLDRSKLKDRYDFTCPCGFEGTAAPSLAMHSGLNLGSGTCPECGAFLRLRIDAKNERIESSYHERTMEASRA